MWKYIKDNKMCITCIHFRETIKHSNSYCNYRYNIQGLTAYNSLIDKDKIACSCYNRSNK